MNLMLLGAPGSGKGTQAVRLCQAFNLCHVASGDIFRRNIQSGTPLGLRAKHYVEAGELVPDSLTISMVMARLSESDCLHGFLLDGFPRTINQARTLDHTFSQHGRHLDHVLYLHVTEADLYTRLVGRFTCRKCQATYHQVNNPPQRPGSCDKCGGELYQRADDRAEAISQRLAIYFTETRELCDYYHQRGILSDIDGGQGIEGVTRDLFTAVTQSLSTAS